MKVALELIQPSPNPVRTTWDEDKMNELAQSIKEQGVIVPVKVRKTEWTYELIYGHRRVEAARRAGLTEIEAIVESVDDDDAQWQALIENMVREDMTDMDKGRELASQHSRGSTWEEIGQRVGLGKTRLLELVAFYNAPPEIKRIVESAPGTTITAKHYSATRSIEEPELRAAMLEKAVREDIGKNNLVRVAAAVAAAPSPEAKARLLDMEYSPVIHDASMIKERAARYGAHDPFYQDNTPTKQQQFDQTPEVKAAVEGVIDAAKRWNELIKVIRGMAEVGKMAPESRQFIAHRARTLAKTLTDWANELEARSDD